MFLIKRTSIWLSPLHAKVVTTVMIVRHFATIMNAYHYVYKEGWSLLSMRGFSEDVIHFIFFLVAGLINSGYIVLTLYHVVSAQF